MSNSPQKMYAKWENVVTTPGWNTVTMPKSPHTVHGGLNRGWSTLKSGDMQSGSVEILAEQGTWWDILADKSRSS